jgi:hypothetical protein
MRRLTHILAATAIAASLAGLTTSSAQAMPLPVTSAAQIAGSVPTEHVQWWGWRRGWGWRGGWGGYGGALAAGAVVGGLLGLASASSYYGYGYPYYGYRYSYPYYSYGYYPSYYSYPSYYGYYGGYWASGKQPSGRRVATQKRARQAR